ncbi:MAG TPA: aminotransferase class III-fold pyridoxal phosphate-dependent enzyme, partial [Deltaproteobacteria bacterium]|nr:aminotransferase class III-fold pyridoxal phosphate-dependent enzyme [Deltaproteobacteria bacterium]
PDPDLLERVMDGCIERGLIIVECGTHKNIARLMPPLMTSREEMQQAISILEEAIEASI